MTMRVSSALNFIRKPIQNQIGFNVCHAKDGYMTHVLCIQICVQFVEEWQEKKQKLTQNEQTNKKF